MLKALAIAMVMAITSAQGYIPVADTQPEPQPVIIQEQAEQPNVEWVGVIYEEDTTEPQEEVDNRYLQGEEYFYNDIYNHENVDLVYDEQLARQMMEADGKEWK